MGSNNKCHSILRYRYYLYNISVSFSKRMPKYNIISGILLIEIYLTTVEMVWYISQITNYEFELFFME